MTELGILVTGRAASGKSSLVNGILGLKVEDEGAAEENEIIIQQETFTTEIKEYRCTKDNVRLKVWDTPGLMDGSHNEDAYIEQMKKKCSQGVDLMIYCINSSVTRFVGGADNEELPVMKILTQAFGREIWEKTVIALTFANNIEMTRLEWRALQPDEKAEKFGEKILQLKRKIRFFLKNKVRIEDSLADSVKIVPAGYHTEPSLPDREFWLSEMWFECLGAIKAPEAREAFYLLSKERIKDRQDLKEGDFQGDMEKQVIVTSDHTKKEIISKLSKYGTAGVVVGGVIGAFTYGIGVVPITVGAVAGAAVAGGVGYFVNYPSCKKDTK